MKENFIIKEAKVEDAEKIGEVFDLYRQFYKKDPDKIISIEYIKQRLTNKESTIFFVEEDNVCIGIVQLYVTFDSLELSKKIILYDLFVRSEYRKKGIGAMLMDASKDFAKKNGITGIELSTAISNGTAQRLYESLGYERDNEFYNYYLSTKK
jgi:ribosomal protein S18 acetylase RimI-like enzyme